METAKLQIGLKWEPLKYRSAGICVVQSHPQKNRIQMFIIMNLGASNTVGAAYYASFGRWQFWHNKRTGILTGELTIR